MTRYGDLPKRLSARVSNLFGSKLFVLGVTVLSFALIFGLGELLANALHHASDSKRDVETMANASTTRAIIERELNSITSVQNGLAGYLSVRRDQLNEAEVNDLLAVLKKSAPHLQNIGVAEGYRMRFMYPLAGNEKALGTDYRTLPEQWPVIQQIVAKGRPAIVGPIDLVQGGRGLIYRAPLNIREQYWGLISAVIDPESLFKDATEIAHLNNFEFAVQSKDVMDLESKPVIGDPALFKHPGAVILELKVPGGAWNLAVEKKLPATSLAMQVTRWLSFILGLLLSGTLYLLLKHRRELSRLVRYDGLTGLPNRIFLEERHALINARFKRGNPFPCALLFVDLDNFKAVNDHHGHRSGDAVLQAIANRMRRITRADDIVVRWGGDEFVALIEGIKPEDMPAFVARLHDIVEEPLRLGEHTVQVGASVGVANYPPNGATLEELLKIADSQMYDDKAQRKTDVGAG